MPLWKNTLSPENRARWDNTQAAGQAIRDAEAVLAQAQADYAKQLRAAPTPAQIEAAQAELDAAAKRAAGKRAAKAAKTAAGR
jgi:hypothetical protein